MDQAQFRTAHTDLKDLVHSLVEERDAHRDTQGWDQQSTLQEYHGPTSHEECTAGWDWPLNDWHTTVELLPIPLTMRITVTLLPTVAADTQRHLIVPTHALLGMHKFTLKSLVIGCQCCQLTLALRAIPRTDTTLYLLFLQ